MTVQHYRLEESNAKQLHITAATTALSAFVGSLNGFAADVSRNATLARVKLVKVTSHPSPN